ncbi:MAG: hypothetical protein ACKOPS_01005, partial [Cyanobium sp.]
TSTATAPHPIPLQATGEGRERPFVVHRQRQQRGIRERCFGTSRTDASLLALAVHNEGTLATLARRLQGDGVRGGSVAGAPGECGLDTLNGPAKD